MRLGTRYKLWPLDIWTKVAVSFYKHRRLKSLPWKQHVKAIICVHLWFPETEQSESSVLVLLSTHRRLIALWFFRLCRHLVHNQGSSHTVASQNYQNPSVQPPEGNFTSLIFNDWLLVSVGYWWTGSFLWFHLHNGGVTIFLSHYRVFQCL